MWITFGFQLSLTAVKKEIFFKNPLNKGFFAFRASGVKKNTQVLALFLGTCIINSMFVKGKNFYSQKINPALNFALRRKRKNVSWCKVSAG